MKLLKALEELKNAIVGQRKAEAGESVNSSYASKGLDGFPLDASSPYFRWHSLLNDFFGEVPSPFRASTIKPANYPSARRILEAAPAEQIEAVEALILRRAWSEQALHTTGSRTAQACECADVLRKLTLMLLRRNLPYSAAQAATLLRLMSTGADWWPFEHDLSLVLKLCDTLKTKGEMSAELRAAIGGLKTMLAPDAEGWESADRRRMREAMERLSAGDQPPGTMDAARPRRGKPEALDGHDAWAGSISKYLAALDEVKGCAWDNLLAHARTASQSKPPGKWLKEAERLLAAVGKEEFKAQVQQWFPSVTASGKPDTLFSFPRPPMVERNAEVLKGLVWYCTCIEDESVTRSVSDLAQRCYRKVPGWGPVSAKVGNACLFTLSQLPGLGPIAQLSRLRLKVKYVTALRLIERALQEAAASLGMSSEELEEIAVPTYGLDEQGILREEFGDFTAEVKIIGTQQTELRWVKSDGKSQKSVPAEVKESCAEELRELKRTIQDIEKMLPAQRDRLERLLILEREWELGKWSERYLNHPLIAHLARRLIWHFRSKDRTGLGIWHGGTLVDAEERPLDWLSSETRVRLWHPLGFEPQVVLGWRRWLETHQVAQPFKQAHREIYVLTEAEHQTGTYSNRFAAHIIKQHQFAALARERGWKYALQGAFDSSNTPTLPLPRWDMAAEFWVNSAGGREDTSDMGIFLYLSTDQVRFCDLSGAPRLLSEVPALVFSEVMRDVDLFVGVCSIGNDPEWQDRGDTGPTGAYWRAFSFGDLSAAAKTRRDVLERLLPRLKIAGQCALREKFLVVRGSLRTYKIHLGSSNVLMEPNDRYLCIVPDRSRAVSASHEQVFLPFEGDNTLAVVLSKAFLLAEDAKIKDQSILSQIRGA